MVRRGQRRVTETHLASLHVSNTAEAPLGAQALNGALRRNPSFPTWAVVLISSDKVCSPTGGWTVRRSSGPASKAATGVPYGSAAALGGTRRSGRVCTSVRRAAVSCGLRWPCA